MKISAPEESKIRLTLVKLVLSLSVFLTSLSSYAQELIAVGRTDLFDISADGQLLLQ